jgi:tripartite-type tricarboxylate transporter receptor subunit TctC
MIFVGRCYTKQGLIAWPPSRREGLPAATNPPILEHTRNKTAQTVNHGGIMHYFAAITASATFVFTAAFSTAQTFPSKPMRMVVPTPPSGSADILGRLVAENLQKRLGQNVITDNRGGAGQTIGTNVVARSDPDGHTLLLVTVSYVINPAIYAKLPYDPATDLTGVAMVGSGPLLVTVHPSMPVRSVKELIAVARTRAGQLDYGSAGAGTIPHLAAELFAAAANVKLQHVPYKGVAPAVTAAVAGEVPLLFVSTPSVGPMVKAQRLRALAVTTAKRTALMPELPTVAESGVPGYDVATWWGVLAPGKTPAPIVNRLNEEIRKILATDEAASVLVNNGATPDLTMTPEQFNALLKTEIASWKKIVSERNIKVN